MLHLLVDTSTWLDLAKRRDGQRWIVAIRVLVNQAALELLVPSVVIDEYGGTDYEQALLLIDELAHQVPLIGAMTTRNFDEVLDLLRAGRPLQATDDDHRRVVERALSKRAPFHRSRNSVADALLIGAVRLPRSQDRPVH